MSANVSYYFKPGDIIGCSIDIDQGQIKYYSNNEDLGIAFDEIRFGNAEVFPCISYRREGYTVYAILDLEIVCEPHSFKCDAIPTGHSPIPCVDRNCLFIQSQNMLRMYNSDVLSSKYTMVHTEKALKPQLEDQSANIYQFDDIDDICFIVPLIREPENVGIYVQPQAGFNFTLIRTFRVNPNHQFKTEDQCSNEIEYLLKTLNNWKHTITNPVTFIEHVGVTLTAKHTDVLTQQAKDLSFPSMPLGATLTQRLVSELDIQCLSNYLKVLLSTFDVVGHAFGFCAIRMNPNQNYGDCDGSELEWFERYEYKLSNNGDDVTFAYNDQLHIDPSNEYHVDLVAEHSLQIQTIKPSATPSSTSFVDNLVSTDNRIIFALNPQNVNTVYHHAISNATYLLVYQDEIDPKATMTESDGVIYRFDDINHLRFIVPFDTGSKYAHLYVKPKENFDFICIKRLQLQKRAVIVNEIDYFLIALKEYDLNITNPNQFYECIGVNIQTSDIPQLQQSTHLYAPTALDPRTTCLHRLVQEFKLTGLSNILHVFDSKMECVATIKSFNCSILRVSNSEYEEKELWSGNTYKFVSRPHGDDAKAMDVSDTLFTHKDKIIVSNNTLQHQSYKVWISNPKLFGVNHYIEIQHMDGACFDQFSNAFHNALRIIDDRVICITNHHDFMPDYGEYSVVETERGYRIEAESFYPIIRPNCTLTDGKYCFEVKIVSEIPSDIYIGFAEQGFVPNNASQTLSWSMKGPRGSRDSDESDPVWRVNDIIQCCIDIPNRLISYSVNGKEIPMHFESININRKLMFPVISLRQGDVVEIRFDTSAFEYAAPTGYGGIDFEDNDVFFRYYEEILNAKYVVLCNENRVHIKAEHVENFIHLDDIRNIQFVVPFCVKRTTVSLYVQLKSDLDFVSFKSFTIEQNHHRDHPQIQYLIDILLTYRMKIKSADEFWRQIGFNGNEWTNERIRIMKQKFYHLIYKPGLLNRLYHELHLITFKNAIKVLSTEFKHIKYSVFDYYGYKIDLDKNEDHSPFMGSWYKLIGVSNDENKENEADSDSAIKYKYNEQLTIINNAQLLPFHKIMVMNDELFGTDQFIELQLFKTPVFRESDTYFKRSLQIEDNRFISLKLKNGDYGVYDVERMMTGRCTITAKSEYATVRANCLLRRGLWYYKVTIVEPSNASILIGFANTNFKPSPHLRVGDDANSWSFNGMDLSHNGKRTHVSSDMHVATLLKRTIFGALTSTKKTFQKGDTIACWLDIGKKKITYLVNATKYIAFDNVDFGNPFKPFFPCISLKKGQIIHIDFDRLIEFTDKTKIFVRQFKVGVAEQILNSKYTIVCDAKHSRIKQSKDNHNVFQFDALNEMRFLIPFPMGKATKTVSLFAQNRRDSDFILFKTFESGFDDSSQMDESAQISYLYKALLGSTGWKGQIKDVDMFSHRMGFDVTPLIAKLIQNPSCDLFKFCDGFDSTKRILDRLYEEFDAKSLLPHRKLVSSKFQCVHTSKTFAYCVFKIQIQNEDGDADEKSNDIEFKSSNYKVECIRNHGMQTEKKFTNILDFSEEIIITCRDDYDVYVISVQNKDVFNSDEYVELQRFNKPLFSESSNAFRHHLQVMYVPNSDTLDLDAAIKLIEPQGDYGEYDVTDGLSKDAFIIVSKSQFCSIRGNSALRSGKHYYEVRILETNEDSPGFYIGWADQGFIPNDADCHGVGIDCSEGNSWACNGMETWHNGKQNEAFNVNTCVCGAQLVLRQDYADCHGAAGLMYIDREQDEVWECPKGQCEDHKDGYDVCLEKGAPHDGYWETGDVIRCCIDIDKGEISYYLNGYFLGIAFANISFKTHQLFPAVSMFNNQKIEMRLTDWTSKGDTKLPPEIYCTTHVARMIMRKYCRVHMY
eukprot:703992_1